MIDSFTYFNEQDIFFLRLEYLNPYVDKFVIVELDTTFSLQPHTKTFDSVYSKLPTDIKSKIVYNFITVDPDKVRYEGKAGDIDYKNKSRIIDLYMRNGKMELVKSISSTGYFMMSDIDEFWDPKKIKEAKQMIDNKGSMCWKQDMRSAFIDWKSGIEYWHGTKGSTIDQVDIDTVTQNFYVSKGKSEGYYKDKIVEGGWHFTLMGDAKTKSEQISAKREGPSWEEKLNLTSEQISFGILNDKYNTVVKKGKMRVRVVPENYKLDPVLYDLSKKYTGLWSNGIKPI